MTVTVVGAAILYGGRVLAARRSPARTGWELPGGKVERGESAEAAVVREIAEELACTVEVTGWLAGESPIGEGLVLRVARTRLVAGEPLPSEHDVVRWLGPDQLDDVDWLAADRPFLPDLREAMRAPD